MGLISKIGKFFISLDVWNHNTVGHVGQSIKAKKDVIDTLLVEPNVQ